MARDQQTVGGCPECGSDELTCRYNFFSKDALRIDSWEHKCPNCGFRDTTAYRSDEPESLPDDGVTDICPYCGRQGEVT